MRSLVALLLVACSTTPSPGPASVRTEPARQPSRPSEVAPPADQSQAAVPPVAPEPARPPIPTPGSRGEVVLVPLGAFPADQLAGVAAHLREHAQVEVRQLDRVELPASAWTAKRKRYRAEVLLDHLDTLVPDAPPTTHVLGLTSVDISTTKPPHDDWGIFGLGNMPGRSAVVSTFRLRKKAKNPTHLQRRLDNTALHEVGHTYGLDHCPEIRCPMQDAEGSIANTDAADDDFGPGCRAALDAAFPVAPP